MLSLNAQKPTDVGQIAPERQAGQFNSGGL